MNGIILSGQAKRGDRVVLSLNSGGGTVTGYGLASAQLKRLKVRFCYMSYACKAFIILICTCHIHTCIGCWFQADNLCRPGMYQSISHIHLIHPLCSIHAYYIRYVYAIQVAASGGYLMAAQADTIVASPFAILGSIGG